METLFELPQNREAEMALLGTCLINGKAPAIKAAYFASEAHRQIAAAMQSMESKGMPIDLVLTWEKLCALGTMEEVGGAAYLASLMEFTSQPELQGHYEQIVAKKYGDRQLRVKCAQFAELVPTVDGHQARRWLGELEDAINLATQIKATAEPVLTGFGRLITDLDAKMERGGGLLGIPTGLTDLDELLSGLCRSDLIILAGRPGMGKTAAAVSMALGVARSGRKVAFFSLEMSEEQLLYRIVAQESGLDLRELRSGNLTPEQYGLALRTMERCQSLPLFIDDSPGLSEADIRTRAKKLVPDLVVIDYIGLMQVSRREERRDLDVASITRALKGLAKEMDVPVVALSQLNRKLEERSGRARRPLLSDLRESGSIEQDADVVVFVYRDEVYEPGTPDNPNPDNGVAELIIGKQRNGPIGTVPVAFDATSTAFRNLDREECRRFWGRRKVAGRKKATP